MNFLDAKRGGGCVLSMFTNRMEAEHSPNNGQNHILLTARDLLVSVVSWVWVCAELYMGCGTTH